MHKHHYTIALGLIDSVGPHTAKKLISHCGGIDAVFKERRSALSKIQGVSAKAINNILSFSNHSVVEQELKFIEKNGIEVFTYLDDEFPFRLKYCPDGPVRIFYKGNKDALKLTRVISIVGTRDASPQGKEYCSFLIQELAELGVLVVSGLAYGIDVTAHKACLQCGVPTIGVLGHGLDRLYPAAHRKIAHAMLEEGGLISEFVSGTNPDRENFPSRNRIVAGMAEATIVVESTHKGGSLITADLAFGYNRDVYAVPGRPSDSRSAGCNLLIKQNKASLLTSIEDIVKGLDWDIEERRPSIQKQLFVELNEDEHHVLKHLQAGKSSLDEISLKSNMPVSRVSGLLLNMEFKGVVRTLPGKVFEMT